MSFEKTPGGLDISAFDNFNDMGSPDFLIAFGRPYLSNPDLVERFANGWELNPPADIKVWSAPTAQG